MYAALGALIHISWATWRNMSLRLIAIIVAPRQETILERSLVEW